MNIDELRSQLLERIATSNQPRDVLKAEEIKQLYALIPTLDPSERGPHGKAVNELKLALEAAVAGREAEMEDDTIEPLDVSAPWDVNTKAHRLLPTEQGTQHPLTRELENVIDIFTRMGFEAIESRQVDDDEHMFGALNFPENHPARDGYDTFRTEEGFIPPAHTSTMQNRILKDGRAKLEAGGQIAAISYGRVFRNEDVDATHEHTFYQLEGMMVDRDVSVANLIYFMKTLLSGIFHREVTVRLRPGYFPFVEPGFELDIQCLICGGPGCPVCKYSGWVELLPCGLIHPNVLRSSGIDPDEWNGFAFGLGLTRLAMMRYGIDDIRQLQGGDLRFLTQF